MTERLRPRDVAFLADESPSAPRHNATVEIFDPEESGLRLRPAGRPDLRTGSRSCRATGSGSSRCPGGSPTRSGSTTTPSTSATTYAAPRCPAPARLDQLRELVARIVSRPLDRSRPLWEIYFVEGLADGQVALLYKTHQVLVDGVDTVDLGQVLLDRDAEARGPLAGLGRRLVGAPQAVLRRAAAPAPSGTR